MQEEHRRQAAPTIAPTAQALSLPKPCTHPGFKIPAPLSNSEQDLLGIRRERWGVNFNAGVPASENNTPSWNMTQNQVGHWLPGSEPPGAGGQRAAEVWRSRRSQPSRIVRSHSSGTCPAKKEGASVVDWYPLYLPLSSHMQSWPSLTPHLPPHKCTKFYSKKKLQNKTINSTSHFC